MTTRQKNRLHKLLTAALASDKLSPDLAELNRLIKHYDS